MASNSLVSVFLPVYNAERFLYGTLEAIRAQTHLNVEVVISDDASTDRTVEIIESYDREHPDLIRLYRQEKNLGVAANCNFVLDRCLGEYIVCIGGDDILLPTKLEEQIDAMEAHNAIMTFHDYDYFDYDQDTVIKRNKRNKSQHISAKNVDNFPLNTISTMIRRPLTEGLRFSEKYPLSDSAFFLEYMFKNKGQAYYMDKVLMHYGRHGNNLNPVSANEPLGNDAERFLSKVDDYIGSRLSLLLHYPEQKATLLESVSNGLRYSRHAHGDKKKYRGVLVASFMVRPNLKSLVLYLVSFVGIIK